jgi:hypothetical protein
VRQWVARAQHERLLAAREKAWEDACAVAARFSAEDDVRAAEMRAAMVEGREPDEPQTTPPAERQEQHGEALLKWETATDVLVEFLERTTAEIRERADAWYAALDTQTRDAESKREEAARLLSEADYEVRAIARKRFWLDRGSGRSVLGYYPYEQMAIPEPPESLDLESVLAGGAVTGVTSA